MKYTFEAPWLSRSDPRDQMVLSNPETGEKLTAKLIREIQGGSEGYKAIIELSTPEGQKRYFMKEFKRTGEAEEQMGKYRFLKDEGVNVPEEAHLFKTSEGRHAILFSDLSNGGTRTVLSSNDPHVEDRHLMNICHSKIPEEVKQKLKQQLIHASEVGANKKPKPLNLWAHPYGLVLDKKNPDDANFFVVDFGWDIEYEAEGTNENIRRSNLFQASRIYSIIIGDPLILPPEHPLASELNEELLASAEKMIHHRGFSGLEEAFKVLE